VHQTTSSTLAAKNCIIESKLDVTVELTDCVMEALTANEFGENRAENEKRVRVIILETGLKSIEDFSFTKVPGLTYLTLANNQINSLAPNAFNGLTILKYLKLQHNEITVLPENIFITLTGLFYLDLSFNKLKSFEFMLLKNNHKLYTLDLNNNSITRYTTDPKGSELVSLLILKIESDSATEICISDLPDMPKLNELSIDMKHVYNDNSSNIRKHFPNIKSINKYYTNKSTDYSFTCEERNQYRKELADVLEATIKEMQAQHIQTITDLEKDITKKTKEIGDLKKINEDIIENQNAVLDKLHAENKKKQEQALKSNDIAHEVKMNATIDSLNELNVSISNLKRQHQTELDNAKIQNNIVHEKEKEELLRKSNATINRLEEEKAVLKTIQQNNTAVMDSLNVRNAELESNKVEKENVINKLKMSNNYLTQQNNNQEYEYKFLNSEYIQLKANCIDRSTINTTQPTIELEVETIRKENKNMQLRLETEIAQSKDYQIQLETCEKNINVTNTCIAIQNTDLGSDHPTMYSKIKQTVQQIQTMKTHLQEECSSTEIDCKKIAKIMDEVKKIDLDSLTNDAKKLHLRIIQNELQINKKSYENQMLNIQNRMQLNNLYNTIVQYQERTDLQMKKTLVMILLSSN
jgi:hypothetical protein